MTLKNHVQDLPSVQALKLLAAEVHPKVVLEWFDPMQISLTMDTSSHLLRGLAMRGWCSAASPDHRGALLTTAGIAFIGTRRHSGILWE